MSDENEYGLSAQNGADAHDTDFEAADDLLWPVTAMIVQKIRCAGFNIPRLDAHEQGEPEGADFVFGEITPHLELSEGEYMSIDMEMGLFSYTFGTRGCCGGDPTYGGECYLEVSESNAENVARYFLRYFAQ